MKNKTKSPPKVVLSVDAPGAAPTAVPSLNSDQNPELQVPDSTDIRAALTTDV